MQIFVRANTSNIKIVGNMLISCNGKDNRERVESRTCSILTAGTNLSFDLLDIWQGIQTVIKIDAVCIVKDITTTSTRYYISGLTQQPAQFFNRKIRSYWSIENKPHWHCRCNI